MARTAVAIALVACMSLAGAASAQSAPPASGTPVSADRSLLAAELAQLERERAEISLGGPIAMLAVGGAVFALGGTILLATALSDAWCSGGLEDRCSGPDDAFYVVSGVAILGGGALALVGLLQLIDRAGERRRLGVRIKELRRVLEPSPAYGVHVDPAAGRAAAVVRLRF